MSKKVFLPLNIPGLVARESMRRKRLDVKVNTHNQNHFLDKDWKNIWPAPAVFNHSVVPLPIKQGYVKNLAENKGVIPDKYANAELMKIPNFLHLTPIQIKDQCAELKKYLTPWPSGLKEDTEIDKYYPIVTIRKSYLRSSSDKRDQRSITASLRVNLNNLELNDKQKLKLLRLSFGSDAGKEYCSYDWTTKLLTISSNRCPTYQQNLDFINYTLNVLVAESLKVDSWEDEEGIVYDWEKSKELQKLLDSGWTKEKIHSDPIIKEYRSAVEKLYSKNSLLERNIYELRPEPYIEKKRHNKYRAIYDVPFEPVHECADRQKLNAYKTSVMKLFRLEHN